MKDILPEEMQIRDYVISVIKDTYGKFGFTSIETPCVENIANLSSKQGGDNEKLIFKILKRGEKLNVAAATTEEEVVDSGLRYDLTVPLVRYYSNNAASLPSPLRHCRWAMYGERTDLREEDIVSLCSVISIFWENLRIWRRSTDPCNDHHIG